MSRRINQSNQGPSQRQLRAGQVIRGALVEILDRRDFSIPVLDNTPITVGEVRMSPDLKHATAFVSPFGDLTEDHRINVISALNAQTSKIQKQLGKKISLKFTPSLRFLYDTSYDEALNIDRLLHSINKNKN